MARANYNALANQNYEAKVKCDGFDPLSIEEKMKKLKYAKADFNTTKDTNWFKNLNNTENASKSASQTATSWKPG